MESPAQQQQPPELMSGRAQEQLDDGQVNVEDKEGDADIEALKDQDEVATVDGDIEDAADVRTSTQSSNKYKLVPMEGLQTKTHSARSPTNAQRNEEAKKGGKEPNPFVWGPQTRTSIKKQ